jgi:hypothetical protein
MSKSTNGKLLAAGVVLLLLAGIMRALSGSYVERRDAIMAACRNELKSSGLDASALKQKYPTPEVTFSRPARVAPGGVGEVVLRGTFRQGTKFLFDSDKVEVVKETLNARAGQKESEYHATIKAAQSPLPDSINIESYEPQLCRGTSVLGACIGGKYEWDFTADNDWKIQLRQLSEGTCSEGEASSLYRAEFYRSAGPKPFEVRNVRVGCRQERCSGRFEEASAQQDEMAQLQKKMQNFASLSEQERDKLMARIQEVAKEQSDALSKRLAEAQSGVTAQKEAEFGCGNISFQLKGSALEGNMVCGEKVGSHGQLKLQGTTKFVGP